MSKLVKLSIIVHLFIYNILYNYYNYAIYYFEILVIDILSLLCDNIDT